MQNFPQPTGKWQVSTKGGSEGTWRGDSGEIYFLEGNRMMALEVKGSATGFEPGIPKLLFDSHVAPVAGRNRYVVTADGKRFLMLVSPVENTVQPMIAWLNWQAEHDR